MKTNKLINDPDAVVDEMVEGMLAAHPRHLRRAEGHRRALVAVDGPRPGKVGIVVGGGSGHEPTFAGLVGRGLADAVAVGNVFASPPPDPILAATRAADGGAGVIYLYGNYAGDCMNFDMAAELAALDGVEVRTVVTVDDVASAPPERRDERRGVAGNAFVFKVAGAAADRMLPLGEVERLTRRAVERTFTVGVALSPCSLPQTRVPNFAIPEGEMEIGMGIHGEPGVERARLRSADAVADDILDRIFAECGAGGGDSVAVMVNSLGSTPMMELYLLERRIKQRLDARGIAIHRSWVGAFCTALEMAGASITLMWLDDELAPLLDRPADAAQFRV